MYEERATDGDKPAVRWLPFQLNPDLPVEGIPRQQYIERKFGPGGGRKYDHVAAVGKTVGIEFAFDNIKVQPNTVNAHRLMHYATAQARDDAVAESIFAAYFIEGANLTDLKTLADIGVRGGLARAALEAYMASDEDRELVVEKDIAIRNGGISGVPFFIFNRKLAVSGAHEPETLLKAILESLAPAAGA
jgi:predicted DsbA family dithiol-disulfide isomerase